jgi:hypothetical protein
MITRLGIPFGQGTLTLEAEDPKDVLEQAAVFLELPSQCPLCHAPVRPFFRRAPDSKGKVWPYWGLVCTGPIRHENTFGQHAEDNRLFYKARAWTVKPTGAGSAAPDDPEPPQPPADIAANECSGCRRQLTTSQITVSTRTFGRPLCPPCQKKATTQ